MNASTAEVPPNETLYINNLNEKIKKEEMRRALYSVFCQFGTVLDVLVKKTLKMRGQAFVVFRDIGSATTALRQMQNFPFFDKQMKIQYAKVKSDLIAKLQGTFVEREKRPRPEKAQKEKKEKKRPPKKNKVDTESKEEEGKDTSAPTSLPVPQPKAQPPNHKLFIQNLPEQTNAMMLQMLFQQFPGFKEVRMVPGNKGIAFVEFGNELEAGVALSGLQNFKVTPSHSMVISFAKK